MWYKILCAILAFFVNNQVLSNFNLDLLTEDFLKVVGIVMLLLAVTEQVIEYGQNQFVDGYVRDYLEKLKLQIKEKKFDPFFFDRYETEQQLPIQNLINYKVNVATYCVCGLSDIVVKRLQFSLRPRTVEFEISLPEIWMNLGEGTIKVALLKKLFAASGNGRLFFENTKIHGKVYLALLPNISVRDLKIQLEVGGIQSHLQAEWQQCDYSDQINKFFNEELALILDEFKVDIGIILSFMAMKLIELTRCVSTSGVKNNDFFDVFHKDV